MKEVKSYLGRGWAFPVGFTKGLGVDMVSDEEDIRQSLRILISTTPGQRTRRGDYGCAIRRWVFEDITLSEKTLIADEVRQAVLHHEPRVEVLSVKVDFREPEHGVLWIEVDYRTRATNSRSNMVFPFYFREGTDL